MKRLAIHGGSSTTAQGFSRTDLVVSVAACVVLAGVAASGLSSSRDDVSRMTCGRNMRQIAMAVGMYACDNDDYLPYCNWDGGTGTDPVAGWLYTLPVPAGLVGAGQVSIPDPFTAPWNTNGAVGIGALPASAWESGTLFTYVKSPRSYLCPTDIQSPDWLSEPAMSAGGPGRNNKLSSYMMNAASCNFGGMPAITRVANVWSPDCYLLWEVDEHQFEVYQGNPGELGFNDGANRPTAPPEGGEGLGSLHGNNGGEIITVGGDVKFVTLATYQKESDFGGAGPDHQSLCWWAPNLEFGGGPE